MVRKAFLLLTGLLFLQTTTAVNTLEYASNLTISDGLAHNGVTCLLEDSQGYLWVGTYDGINHYDGYNFVTHKNSFHRNVLSSNRVRSLAEDKKGNIWIGTDEGISLYDYGSERFKIIYSQSNKNGKGKNGPIVRNIIVSKNGQNIFCLTEGNGVLIFNEEYKLIKHIYPDKNIDENGFTFYDGVELDSINYLLLTTAGLMSYNHETGVLKLEIEQERGVSNASILLRGKTIIATRQRGLSIVKLDKDFKDYKFRLKEIRYSEEQFNSLSIDKNQNLWLGTVYDGVIHINNVKSFLAGKDYTEQRFANVSRVIRTSSIVANTQSGCWITTFNKGIYRFNIDENPFRKLLPAQQSDHPLTSTSISHISAWTKDKIFISAHRGGFGLYNTKTEKFEPLPFDLPANAGNVAAVYVDSRKDIWLKLMGQMGLCRVKHGTRKLVPMDQKKFPKSRTSRPRTITEDQFGNIWLGGENGVYKISIDDDGEVSNFESFNDHPFFNDNKLTLVRCIYADPLRNFIWIGTDSDGLIRVNNDNSKALHELEINRSLRDKSKSRSISSNFVSTIVRLPNNELWLGTERGGICKVLNDDTEPEFISFSERNGLSNNVVKRIFYDEEYNLWVATNIGLNKFFTKDNHFRSFKKEDGLPFEDFWYSYAKLGNGYVVLSGLEGLCYFKPGQVDDKEALPRLLFTNLKVFNKGIATGDTLNNRVLLERRLDKTDEIVLKHNENVFSFELDALHYSTPDNHYLRYQLLPISDEWIEVTSDQKVVTYSGLRPGEYKFRAMASNSLSEWTKPKEIDIIIKPPIWKTGWAYFIYVIIIGLIVYTILYFVLQMQSLKHNLEIEHLEGDKVKEVNAAKLRFFSNISHEIKTPLTLISGPINILSERFKANSDVSEKLQIVQRQSKKISQLIDQVHDFQRSDANYLDMAISQFCVDDFILELKADFDFMAQTDKKKLEVIGFGAKVYVSADRDKLSKIFNNLLNNAFKYTKEGDTIKIDYKAEENDLLVNVSDSGKGIHNDDLPFVFDRFYQSKHKHSQYTGGSGIGLAFSKRLVEMHYGDIGVESILGEGAVFNLRLPIVIDRGDKENEEKKEDILKLEREAEVHEVKTDFDISNIIIDEEFLEASVFFAEDNTEMRNFVSGALSKFFKVRTFANGKECVDALQEEWPDIVISDVLMPELNGFDVCKTIKADVKTSHIPVILLTACTAIDDQIQGLELGADAYIKKPFNMQHLITRTEALLKNRKQLRERYNIDLPLTKQKEDSNASDNAFLEKLYQLMEKNLDNQELDLDGFAKELYLNRTHFFQKVKAITNQTPYELLKNYRVKKAAEFLVQEKLSVNEVFIMTGFKSRAHFNKLFKEKYEVTPGKYASEMQKKYAD